MSIRKTEARQREEGARARWAVRALPHSREPSSPLASTLPLLCHVYEACRPHETRARISERSKTRKQEARGQKERKKTVVVHLLAL